MLAIGLQLNFKKCEPVAVGQTPVAATQHHFPPPLLFDEQGADRVVRNFTLLGAPIGDDAFCGAHTAARAKLAGPLLDHIAELEDPQIGLRLLKSTASYSKMVPSSATHLAALQDFDRQVRGCFAALTGLHLDGVQWEQAARGLALGGLSLRSAARDSSAACLASVGGSNYVGSWTLPTMQSLTAMLPLRFCPTTTILEQGGPHLGRSPRQHPKRLEFKTGPGVLALASEHSECGHKGRPSVGVRARRQGLLECSPPRAHPNGASHFHHRAGTASRGCRCGG